MHSTAFQTMTALKMLGENAIRFFDLDRNRLSDIAKRIGPRIEDITGAGSNIRPELLASFAQRGGYLKPSEGEDKLAAVDLLIQEDLADLGVSN